MYCNEVNSALCIVAGGVVPLPLPPGGGSEYVPVASTPAQDTGPVLPAQSHAELERCEQLHGRCSQHQDRNAMLIRRSQDPQYTCPRPTHLQLVWREQLQQRRVQHDEGLVARDG